MNKSKNKRGVNLFVLCRDGEVDFYRNKNERMGWNGTNWGVKQECTLKGICDNRVGESILPFNKFRYQNIISFANAKICDSCRT